MARNRDDRDDDEDDRPRRRSRPRDDDEDDEVERPRSRRRSRDEDDEDGDRPGRRRGRRAEEPKSSGSKTAIIVVSILGAVFLLCAGGGFAFYWFSVKPVVEKVQESIDNAKSNAEQSLGAKRMGLGMHNYELSEGKFPTPYYFDFSSTPPWKAPNNLNSQLSWRVSLLPYIEQDRLYKQFDLKASWDSPQNKVHSQNVIGLYADADTPLDPSTRWKVFYDNGALFDSNPNNRVPLSGITDGTSNTIMLVEGGEKGVWSQFNEYKFDPNRPTPQLGRSATTPGAKFVVVMADGSVKNVRQTVEKRILNAAITKAGGEVEAFNLTD